MARSTTDITDFARTLREQLLLSISEIVRQENEKLLDACLASKPLMTIEDVARTLSVSKRTAETLYAAEELPPPLWIRGQRRWHPDTIDAFIRSLGGQRGSR